MDSKTTGKRGRGMTRQEVIERLKSIKSLVDKYDDVMALREAIKALEREPMFIAKSDGTIEQIKNCDDCLYKKEWEKIGKLIKVVLEKQTEPQETETWNGIHAQITAPKGTFERIFNDAEYHGTEDMDGLYYCPICQQTTTVVKDGKCPKCGATMDELSSERNRPRTRKKLSWLGKNCKDCGNKKCKELGTLPRGYDCALWQDIKKEI